MTVFMVSMFCLLLPPNSSTCPSHLRYSAHNKESVLLLFCLLSVACGSWHHRTLALTSSLPPHLKILIECSLIASSHLPLLVQVFVSILLQGYKPKFVDKLDGTLASYQVMLPWIHRTVCETPRLKIKN